MKFRILDLFLMMTFAAVVFAAFKHDLVAFRQLVLFALVSMGAVGGCWFAKKKKNRPILGGAVGGEVGAVIYLGLALVLANQFYEFLPWHSFQTENLWDQWIAECMWVLILAPGMGAAIGPLVISHLQNVSLTANAIRDRLISWALLGGMVLLLFFKMNDRVSMIYGGRDWNAIIVLLIIGFIVHTIRWNRQLTERPNLKGDIDSASADIES